MKDYSVIRSDRRTAAIEVAADGRVTVRAPRGMREERIAAFVEAHGDWIARARTRQANRAAAQADLSEAELRTRAECILPDRLAEWAERMGVSPTGFRVTGAKKRLGSCSAENRICLSYHLMRWPDAVVDYVVVHELAHIRHKHHGPAFYAEIARYLPEYRQALAVLRGRADAPSE